MAGTPSTPLPRGRHNLTREEVAQVQRDRMLVGVAEAMSEKGYVGTSVSDIIKRAGVSRETFYQQFSSKQECFLAAFNLAGELLMSVFREMADEPGTARERLDAIIGVYLESIVIHQPFARLFLVEVYAAGPDAMAKRAEFQHRIAVGLGELLGSDGERDLLACDLIVSGLASIVTMPLVTGDHERLQAIRAPLVDLVLHQLSTEG